MLKIFEVGEAKQTILRRQPSGEDVPVALRTGLRRVFGEEITPQEGVRRILADVRARGDAALREWMEKIDGQRLERFDIPCEEWAAALDRLPADLQASLRVAAERVRAFHARQPIPTWSTTELGGVLGQNVTPLSRVGVYVPGGTAPLPSSLLMSAIPAKVADVKQVVVTTPPRRSDGSVPDVILAAAYLADVDVVYRLGGAQAIAAFAFGTESIARVDKIVGAGNIFVTLAKQQVFGQVGLDGLAGPTETVVVADDSANPAWVAADLLAQAEHDVLATAILLTPSRALAEAVQAEVSQQIESRGRAEIIATSLAGQSGIVITQDLAQAVRLADEFAPEHLCLSVCDPQSWSSQATHAGGLFLGEHSFEVLGDYVAGPSHVMPTGGTARFASPLNVFDFVRITNVIALDQATACELSVHAARIAQAESLDAHAQAASYRAIPNTCTARRHKCTQYQPPLTFRVKPTDEPAPYTPVIPFEVWAERLGRTPESLVKLDANENPYGPSPRALEALSQCRSFHIYPDPESTFLRRALSDFLRLPVEMILTGAGSDELIDLTLRATFSPGDVVVGCPPTFGVYSFLAGVNKARVLDVPRRADFSLDVEGIEAAVQAEPRATVLFLCSPNNPDGSVIPDGALRWLLSLPVLVVLDEAYAEFHGRSRIELAREYSNLVVLRTFSKWAGLAGLRVGYGAFPDWLASRIWRIKQPYNVNVAAALAAIASLQDFENQRVTVERLRAERSRLFEALSSLDGLQPCPSEANFILCRVKGRDALELKHALEREGVLVRYFDKPGLRDCIRISVGRPQDTDVLMGALRKVMRVA
jgi:histidinol dehydrogenase